MPLFLSVPVALEVAAILVLEAHTGTGEDLVVGDCAKMHVGGHFQFTIGQFFYIGENRLLCHVVLVPYQILLTHIERQSSYHLLFLFILLPVRNESYHILYITAIAGGLGRFGSQWQLFRPRIELLFRGGWEWGVYVEVKPGHYISVIPQFVFEIVQFTYLRIENPHSLHDCSGLFASLLPVLDLLDLLDHLLHVPSVFRQNQFLSRSVIVHKINQFTLQRYKKYWNQSSASSRFFLLTLHKISIMHIGVAGNIGSGKTTLTGMLSRHYGWTPRYEAVTYNPYLEDFYKDIPRWSFNLEVYFLTQRLKDTIAISQCEGTVIQDRTIFEGVYIFVANNYALGNLSKRDYDAYMDLFGVMMHSIKIPDLLIYLRCSLSHLVGQIQKRGRDYEQSISLEYLAGLNDRYERFIKEQYPGEVLTIEADRLDFEHNQEDFASITDKLDARLYGLF